ncbi:MAG: zinc-dependent metalloprotease [Saprospiraceae bacterium]|nr:zinc-dependent metalloprotease [Saprospiraceae bacterium]
MSYSLAHSAFFFLTTQYVFVMRNNLSTLFFLLLGTAAAAQAPIICGNEVFSHIVQEHYPALHDAFNTTFEQAKAPRATDRSPLTVNVVVHVVWKNPEENLHDSIILDQMAVLNADYNRMNADTANLRSIFKHVAANADIHFNLVDVVRVQTSKEFTVALTGNNLLAELKSSSQGGSDAWDTEQYVNIWICKIQPITFGGVVLGQILGFAFPPNNLGHWPANSGAPMPQQDGVVIDYRVFGSNNPHTVPVPGGTGNLIVKGRTPVHEMGHYMGLRHIWGDGGLLGLPNNCNQSDGVDDTPFANAQSPFDCNKNKNTCTKIDSFYNADMPDLVENYMDYASEDCMNMFTQGQVDIMRNVLLGPRAGLLSPMVNTQSPVSQAIDFRISPNPASDQVAVRFNLQEKTNVTIRLFNAAGQPIGLLESEPYPAGMHQRILETHLLTPGVYFVEMRTEQGSALQKLLVR